jgi:hypothetical protein
MTEPHPSHLDQRDPAKAGLDIRQAVDAEIEHYGRDLHDLVLLVPEDRWAEFLRLSGCQAQGEETSYRGVTLRKGAVTAVVAQEGF